MATLSPGNEVEPIRLDLSYILTDRGIDDYVAETAADPPNYFTLTIDFSELSADLRRRAYRLYRLQQAARHTREDDIPFGDPPLSEQYPQLERPSKDVATVIAAWEAFHAVRAAAAAKAAEDYRTQQAIAEGKRASFRLEMSHWVHEHGSERLKLGLERDYKIATAYVRERAEQEFPGFRVDVNGKAKWRERANPTLKGLKLEGDALECQAKIASYYKIRIVWLLKDEEGNDAKVEAVVVPEYLLLYNLIGDPKQSFDPDEIPF